MATGMFLSGDLINGATTLISVSYQWSGWQPERLASPVMTPDGHYVAFVSDATDLVPNGYKRDIRCVRAQTV